MALNRIDLALLAYTDSVVVPDTFLTSFLGYSPFPLSLPMTDSVKKVMLFWSTPKVKAAGAFTYCWHKVGGPP